MKNETKPLRISGERKEFLAKYAMAATFLYGIISVDEFIDVFNHYEPDLKTNSEEATLALERYKKANAILAEYSIKDGIISGPEFEPCDSLYKQEIAMFRKMQANKPRYLPDKEEFLRYTYGDYIEPEKPYDDLKKYIWDNKLTKDTDDIHTDLLELRDLISANVLSVSQELEYFTDLGYKFKNLNQANEFAQLLMNAHNNTRMYCNNGHTPNEIGDMHGKPRMNPLPKEPFNSARVVKVGVNDPCPCGSGKKYKKCCMG